jgi:hypothetical protein
MTTALPLRAAAARLGVREDTLRKRLQKGLHPGHKADGAWLVDVPDHPGPVPDPSGTIPDQGAGPGPIPDAPGASLASQRAQDMAEYSAALLRPYVEKIEHQAERIGRLEAELEHARANGHAQQSAPPAAGQAGRSWWARLFG